MDLSAAQFLDDIGVAAIKVELVLVLGVAVLACLAFVGAADVKEALVASVLVRDGEAPATNFVAGDRARSNLELKTSAGTDVSGVVGEVGEFEAALDTLEDGDALLAELGEFRDVEVLAEEAVAVNGDAELNVLVVVHEGKVGAEVHVELDDVGVLHFEAARALLGGARATSGVKAEFVDVAGEVRVVLDAKVLLGADHGGQAGKDEEFEGHFEQ